MRNFLLFFLVFFQLSFLAAQEESSRDLIISGVDEMMKKNHEKSLELLVKAKTLAELNNENEELFLAINNIGANYYSLLDYGEALSNYLKAYQIAIDHLGSAHEMSVINNIAILYSKEKNFKKAEEYFKKAYDIAEVNNEPNKKGLYAINLGIVLNETENLLEAENYLNEALVLFKDDARMLLEARISLAKNLLLRGFVTEAKDLALKLEPEFVGPEFEEHKISNYITLSKAYQKERNYSRALFYAKEGLKGSLNLENKINLYEQLAQLYIDQDMLLEALAMKDTLIKASNELNLIKNGRLFETSKVKFEIQNYQRELENQQEEIKDQKTRFYTLLSGSIIIIVLIGWALRNSFINNKQKKILHEKAQELITLELEKEKTEKLLLEKQLKEKEAFSLLQQEKLKNEIESKNRKLSAKALYLSDRNNLLNNIIKDLDRIYHVRRDAEIKGHIQNLKSMLKADDDWGNFVKHFEEVNHGFIDTLKQKSPALNTNDIRFLSYVYMNLSMKEISLIFNITPEACRKRKERVSKKLGLKASNELYDFLYQVN